MPKLAVLEKIKGFVGREELVKETFVLAITTVIAAVLNYGFFFVMARSLNTETYGIFYTLISFTYIFGVVFETARVVISKYATKFKVKNENGKIKYLFLRALRKMFLLGGLALIFFILISPLIAGFLKINVWYIILTGVFIFISIFMYVGWGLLQGLRKFNSLGLNILIGAILKFGFGVLFVIIGWNIAGILGAFILGTTAGLVILLLQVNKIIKSKIKKIETKEIYKYSVPVLTGLVLITLMYIVDVLLAKRFFSPEIAGYYSGISTLAKMLFFCSIAVTRVMFPIVSEKHEKGERHRRLLYKSLVVVLIISLIFLVAYTLFPQSVVKIILGQKFNVDVLLGGGEYIPFYHTIKYLAVAMMFLALSYTLAFYKWSIQKKKFVIWIALALVSEVVLLYLFHKNLLQFLWVMIIVNASLFAVMLFNLKRYDDQKNKNNKRNIHIQR